MTNYVLTRWTETGTAEEVLAAMETKLETVDDTKDIYVSTLVKKGNEFVGVLLYAT